MAVGLLALRLGRKPSNAGQQNGDNGFTVSMPAEDGASTLPLVAVYWAAWGPTFGRRVSGPQGILAIWRDGRAVWSLDPLEGGAPYPTGSVAPQKLRKLLGDLDKRGIFKHPVRHAHYYTADTSISIAIADGKRRLDMCASHEIHEVNPEAVFTSTSLTTLEGRSRAAVLAAEPESYRRFRRIWGELRRHLKDLLPREGEDAGRLEFKLQHLTEEERS
jgi:hypothetical protein